MSDLLPLVAVSLKMYLGVAATRAWVAGVLGVAARLDACARQSRIASLTSSKEQS